MSSLAQIKSASLGLLTNLRGWRTKHKLLVIEFDDRGAIHMPDLGSFNSLLTPKPPIDRSRYNSRDCLKGSEHFKPLMNVIEGHSDADGSLATLTLLPGSIAGHPRTAPASEANYELAQRPSDSVQKP